MIIDDDGVADDADEMDENGFSLKRISEYLFNQFNQRFYLSFKVYTKHDHSRLHLIDHI
jgi:hypothetical protein